MRNSSWMREVRAFTAATLLLPLAFTPAVAHMATPSARPPARVGITAGHFSPGRFHVFNRFGAGRFGSNRFGFDRFDNYHFDFGRLGPNRFRYNRFAANAGPLDFGLLGFGGGDWGYLPAYPTAPPAPVVINAGGPPVAINVYAGGGTSPGEVGAADGAACPVVHLLEYDKAGHYAGERQIPGC